jgi:hypothetical protein
VEPGLMTRIRYTLSCNVFDLQFGSPMFADYSPIQLVINISLMKGKDAEFPIQRSAIAYFTIHSLSRSTT